MNRNHCYEMTAYNRNTQTHVFLFIMAILILLIIIGHIGHQTTLQTPYNASMMMANAEDDHKFQEYQTKSCSPEGCTCTPDGIYLNKDGEMWFINGEPLRCNDAATHRHNPGAFQDDEKEIDDAYCQEGICTDSLPRL